MSETSGVGIGAGGLMPEQITEKTLKDIQAIREQWNQVGEFPCDDYLSSGKTKYEFWLEFRLALAESNLAAALPALRMCERVLNDESELGDVEASFVAVEMIEKALTQMDAPVQELQHERDRCQSK